MTKKPTNVAASVRARLRNLARERSEDFQLVLLRYANERLLYRLSMSPQRARFVLKGAALFTVWTGHAHRATRDIDLSTGGRSNETSVRDALVEVLSTEVIEDGMRFDVGSLLVAPIREDQEYGGVRATIRAELESARVAVQVDVGFGDAITPAAEDVEFPGLLEFPAPRLRAYPKETVVAEKLDAIVQLGLANSRMKDFFDLVTLARQFEFDGPMLVRAVKATLERRKTPLPDALPAGLTAEFYQDRAKSTQWRAFLSKSGAETKDNLSDVAHEISMFLEPVLDAARSGSVWTAHWPSGGPWVSA